MKSHHSQTLLLLLSAQQLRITKYWFKTKDKLDDDKIKYILFTTTNVGLVLFHFRKLSENLDTVPVPFNC
jgi:hypothetical protein